jgi:uncharacterized protein YPO0396
MSTTLFNSEEASSGYRLDYMEVFNWGTFDGNVYSLKPGQKTSLLTGANASGKTTLIDALLTMLVPSNKRFYNQSSGAESKKERDENSYFWGYHGKTFSEADDKSKTEQLRKKENNPYSVLLTCFRNEGTLHDVTLVQLRWFSSGSLKKVFIVSPHKLNISDNFGKGKFDTRGEWRKKLIHQFPKTDLFDSFKDYANRFSDLFGLKEQALSLFNQTVGIKVLGDLTQFIRSQMLEQPDAESQFSQLYEHYNDLLLSHKAIQKDEKQLELLEPIIQSKSDLNLLEATISSFENMQAQIPFFLDEKESELLEMNAREIEDAIDLATAEQKKLTEEIQKEEGQQRQLIAQRVSLNLDSRIELAKKDIETETAKRDSKKGKQTEYLKDAAILELQTDMNAKSFKENYDYTKLLEKEWSETIEDLNNQKFNCRFEKDQLIKASDELQKNIASLLSRKDRMPHHLIVVRKELADLLDVSEETLPFAGELIKVKDNCLDWEDSIERVLNSLAMQLLVPQRFHKQVNHYVNANNLKTRLVYQRVEDKVAGTIKKWPIETDYMLNKLDFKDAGIYQQWLENQLLLRYDFYCTDNLDVFFGSTQAITSKGLIRNGSRHEKDDRPGRWDKLQYRLGWDNTGTIRLLMEQKKKNETAIGELNKQLEKNKTRLQVLEQKQKHATLLLSIGSFHEIDFSHHAAAIVELERQMEQLVSSSNKYQTIIQQLKECDKRLSDHRQHDKTLEAKIVGLRKEYETKSKRRLELNFDELTEDGKQSVTEFIKTELNTEVLPRSLDDLQLLIRKLAEATRKRGIVLNSSLRTKRETMIRLISAFCNPLPSVLSEFPDWSGDVLNIRPEIESMTELQDLYKTIKHQRLVEHKRRFREYMDNSMLDSLTNFRTWLDTEEEKIKEMIEDLNDPLKKITFNKNPDTYLQLEWRLNKDTEMKDFKQRLSETIPDIIIFTAQKEQAYRDSVFLKIKTLIEELKHEENWRRKVTDVRNRLLFNAREYTIAEGKAGQYHEDTASYSGGQKAQFTYAILGAAIAYQFGIFQQGKQFKSLRFITVDEAFSKLDPEKSQFLMEFCAQLNLQLLVVTPLDKINIAEPYINAVHFVEIKNKMHSNVYNLTMEEYHERKEEFQQLEQNQR